MTTEANQKKYLKIYENELTKIEKRILKLFENRFPDSLYEPCKYAIKGGGKRIRPFLVLCSAKAAGGKFSRVYNAAAAVELLHNFTLVHDDIMDNSEKRRGRPTVHIKYDVNTAILSGDSLIATAYEQLLKDCSNDSKTIIDIFTQGIVEVCEGQSLDKDFESRENVSIDEYKQMIYKKTAALLVMSAKIGARLIKDSKEIITAVSKYAANIGMAFQIHDDLLDVIGEETKFGKQIGSDLLEGKKTYLFLKAFEKASGKDRIELNNFILYKGINKVKIPLFKEIYQRLGVIDDAQNEIKLYTNSAVKQIEHIKNSEARNLLEWLANFLLGRIK